jgi:molybdate transport system substrate-binding protein
MHLPIARVRICALFLVSGLFVSLVTPAAAQTNAPIVVEGTVAVKGVLDKVAPLFEKATGRKVVLQYDSAAALTTKAASGEGYDVVITSAGAVDGFAKSGAVLADSEAVIGSAVASLVYKHGTPTPQIATPEALKAVLLAAKSISFSDPAAGGASSVYFAGVVQRLGISDAVMQKATLTKVGEGAVPASTGQTQYAVAQSSEYAVIPGLDGVPIFPSDPKSTSNFAAAVSAKSAQPDGARAFVRFLVSPDGTAVRKAMGLAGAS